MRPLQTRFGYRGLALLVVTLWASTFVVQKVLLNTHQPAQVLVARSTVALLAAAIIGLLASRGQTAMTWRDMAWAAGLGVAINAIYPALVTVGIHMSTPFSAAVVLAAAPVFALLLARLIDRKPGKFASWIAVVVCYSGVVIYQLDQRGSEGSSQLMGNVLVLLAAGILGAYTVFSRPVIERCGSLRFTCVAMFVGSLAVVAPLTVAGDDLYLWEFKLRDWLFVIWLGFIATFGGYWLWGIAVRLGTVARVAPIQFLVPIIAGYLSWAFAAEAFSTYKVLGAALTVVGAAALSLLDRPKPSKNDGG